jgi:hypothetical protein
MNTKLAIVGFATTVVLGAASVQASITLGFEDFGQGASLNGNGGAGGSFSFSTKTWASQTQESKWLRANNLPSETIPSQAQTIITGASGSGATGDSVGLFGSFTSGSTWNYGQVTPEAGGVEAAAVQLNKNSPISFYIGNAKSTLLSGTVSSATISSTALGGTRYLDTISIVVSELNPSLASDNNDLQTLLASAKSSSSIDITYSWFSSTALNKVTSSGNTGGVTGQITASAVVSPVPEPTTVAAGAAALGLLFFMRVRAKRQ